MYDPPPSMPSGPQQSDPQDVRTLVAIGAVVLLVALGVIGVGGTWLAETFGQEGYDAVGYGALICSGPLLTAAALFAILLIFQLRVRAYVHWLGYTAGCLIAPIFFMGLAVITWGLIEALTGGPIARNEPLLKESAHNALLASRIALVMVTPLCVLLVLWLTRLLRRREALRWQ